MGKNMKKSIKAKKLEKAENQKVTVKTNKTENKLKIGIVTAQFNSEITERLEEGARSTLLAAGVQITAVQVPGAIEIPLACQALLLDGDCDGVVALGAVIRGETSHYDYVCNSVERGITQLMLATRRPIGFGVLTTENEEQAFARVGGAHGHKGIETAQVVLKMLDLLQEIKMLGTKKTKTTKNTKRPSSTRTK